MDITRSTLPFYARYFHAVSPSSSLNLFDTSNFASIGASSGFVIKVQNLNTAGVLKSNGTELLVPLEGQLVMPTSGGSTNIPLVLIGHGNARSYFNSGTTTVGTEFLSFNGYQVLQNELAANGIASFSINLNIVNALGVHSANNDFYYRIELFFFHLLLMKFLAGKTISIPGTDPFPILYDAGTSLISLNTALTNSDSAGGNTALQALKTLKDSLNNKFDFTNLGYMGHSRGASAVSRIFEYFYDGTTQGEASSGFNVNPTLNTFIKKLVNYCGNPIRDNVKCIFALQPDEIETKIESTKTMFFVVAGSHDEDVGAEAASIYESVAAPKVMIFVHGGTHKRFNTVWRSPRGGVKQINLMIRGDPVIRVLSNRKHDDISRVIFSSFFRATLKNEHNQYLYFSRDVRYPIRVDIERSWNFGYPFQALPAAWKKFDNDLKNTNIVNATGSGAPNITLPYNKARNLESTASNFLYSTSKDFTGQEFSAFLYLKPTNLDTATLTISINVNLSNYTHFSLRFAKWYKVRKTDLPDPPSSADRGPRRVDLRNFTIQLFQNNTAIGRKIDGENVRSLLHRAYPTLKYTPGGGNVAGYYWNTNILLQTVEVSLSEFQVPNNADLSRVNKIVMELTPEAYKKSNDKDVFVFNDFLVTKRALNMPTTP